MADTGCRSASPYAGFLSVLIRCGGQCWRPQGLRQETPGCLGVVAVGQQEIGGSSVFVDGAVARGVPAARAGYIFDLIEKFAGYGFNKSHSVAYALLAYQTAWLKAHYPEAFMAAVLSCDMENTDKVVSFIDECAGLGLEVQPPDVNESSFAFTVAGPGTIRGR